MPAPRSPEAFLGTRVDDLDGPLARAALRLRRCGAKVFYPFKLLARRAGLSASTRCTCRFRCKHCGGRPVRVGVTNNPARGLQYVDVWTVPLVR
jgi:hypothetical protein